MNDRDSTTISVLTAQRQALIDRLTDLLDAIESEDDDAIAAACAAAKQLLE